MKLNMDENEKVAVYIIRDSRIVFIDDLDVIGSVVTIIVRHFISGKRVNQTVTVNKG